MTATFWRIVALTIVLFVTACGTEEEARRSQLAFEEAQSAEQQVIDGIKMAFGPEVEEVRERPEDRICRRYEMLRGQDGMLNYNTPPTELWELARVSLAEADSIYKARALSLIHELERLIVLPDSLRRALETGGCPILGRLSYSPDISFFMGNLVWMSSVRPELSADARRILRRHVRDTSLSTMYRDMIAVALR